MNEGSEYKSKVSHLVIRMHEMDQEIDLLEETHNTLAKDNPGFEVWTGYAISIMESNNAIHAKIAGMSHTGSTIKQQHFIYHNLAEFIIRERNRLDKLSPRTPRPSDEKTWNEMRVKWYKIGHELKKKRKERDVINELLDETLTAGKKKIKRIE